MIDELFFNLGYFCMAYCRSNSVVKIILSPNLRNIDAANLPFQPS